MRIYKMTATFGKLEHQTLTLEPGLNVITAPNEWGKSTWCAFLVAMLYGLDTRAKTTKNTLADKERYAPWSGQSMEGRIDLHWNGRDITIERRTKHRIPLGEFKAYETETGLPVNELTAANCGQMLLGVEQSVFRRAGFIRHADLPMTQDEALRRRLNALVTTGDESGAADRLAATLRDLKNRCRYNRTGLLPQAEGERDALEAKLAELESLEAQCRKLKQRIDELKIWIRQLANHRQALEYAAAEAHAARTAQAREAMEAAEAELAALEEKCALLPPKEAVEQKLQELKTLREQWTAVKLERQVLPEEPNEPVPVKPFENMTPEEAKQMAATDAQTYAAISKTKMPGILILMGFFGLAAAAGLVFLRAYLFAGIAGAGALAALIWGIAEKASIKKKTKHLTEKYGNESHAHWADPIAVYERELAVFREKRQRFQDATTRVETREQLLQKKQEALCGQENPEELIVEGNQAVETWNACLSARREAKRAQSHFEALHAMVKKVDKPAMPDTLTQSETETTRLLSECSVEQQRLQNRLGQYQGRMEALGDRTALQRLLTQKTKRITRLEETYTALVIAQETLNQARAELQRRFAPRITKRAQKLLSSMTGGRYNAVTMGEDFSLQARAETEDTLHDAIWRSDGTMDQLYLALRLAVAEELTPEAPLILDDALVRFDDGRMRAAVSILEEMAQQKQVILFTCQGREAEI